MYLKSIELQGFKSFPDRTKLNFDRGMIAVVGPNGSGKSNIGDAIRWVLGEQSSKTLRGSKMEDVIFGGTKRRKQSGFAEVLITFDNTAREFDIDSDEVTIARKLYRSGEGEYRINKMNVRLKDVHELLMDTGIGRDGYSIIGQGKIAEIVSAKSGDRREIFEEAAGISKYRYRKEEALKRLELAQDNLVRLNDILGEVEGRIEPLRIQSQKAKKFVELEKKRRELQISLWIQQLNALQEKIVQARRQCEEQETAYQQNCTAVERTEKEIEEIYTQIQRTAVELDAARNRKNDYRERISQIESDLAVSQNDLLHQKEMAVRLDAQLIQLGQGQENNETLARQNEEKIVLKQQQIAQTDETLRTIYQKVQSRQSEILKLQSDVSRHNAQILILQNTLSEHRMGAVTRQSQRDAIEHSLQALSQTIAENQASLELCMQELEEAALQKKTAEDTLQMRKNQTAGYLLKRKNQADKLERLNEELQSQSSKLRDTKNRIKMFSDLEKNLDGYQHSVRAIAAQAQAGHLKGVHGPVSQLIQVEEAYAYAVETALGFSMQNIVVEDENAAKQAISYLKKASVGRATFLPLTAIHGKMLLEKGLESCEGFVGLASDLVSCKERYRDIVVSLLGRTAITETLDDAVIMAKRFSHRFRIVTLDGSVINAGGSMSGGSRNQNTSLLSRASEIQRLQKEAAKIEEETVSKQASGQRFLDEIMVLDQQIQTLQQQAETCNLELVKRTEQIHQLQRTQHQTTELLAAQEEEQIRLQKQFKELSDGAIDFDALSRQTQQEMDQLTEESSQLTVAQQELTDKLNELTEQRSTYEILRAEQAKDLESLQQQLKSFHLQTENFQDRKQQILQEQCTLETNREALETTKKNLEEEKNTLLTRTDLLDEEMKQFTALSTELEAKATVLRAQEKSLLEFREKVSVERSRYQERMQAVQTKYDDIIAKLWDEYEMTRSEAEQTAGKIEDSSEATALLAQIRAQIKALGFVNVAAIEEYEQLNERYTFMKTQVDDAQTSRTELLKIVNDLTDSMKELFVDCFEKTNRYFGEIFTQLFGGGRAYFKLSDPNDVLTSGIEIFVEPPGKIIKNLSALSGGEQAFVAIAIYFAILKVKPTPFCVLDEIEAALDDVNVNKYAAYLQNLCHQIQFILITHRRGTMEQSDVLYGVTMQEEGVSKLLKMNIEEIETQILNQTKS